MSIYGRCVLRHFLRCRVLSYGRYLHLRGHQRSVIGLPLNEGPACIGCRRQFLTTTGLLGKHEQSSDYDGLRKEENVSHDGGPDENVPLIVKLMSRAHEYQKKDESPKLTVANLQKTLEDIKWDMDATIKRADIEGLAQQTELESEEPETDNQETDYNSTEMTTIEDIYLDEDISCGQAARKAKQRRQKVKGTPDPSVPVSDVPCSGCGANLHCQDPILPGYIPSEKFICLTREDMSRSVCQRCFLIQAYNMFLNVRVSAETYPQILREIRNTRALVIVVVDLFDMKNSVFTDLLKYIGTNRPLFIVGNKVDLIPSDSKGYLERTRQSLVEICNLANLNPTGKNLKHVCMVSAKTGYGIENLVTKLMTVWQLQGHVYVVGSTNAGKSTLFNALLMSDYCKSVARGFINRATVSVWPGTTLNLLKFPIVSPAPWKLLLRSRRLQADARKHADEEMARSARLTETGRYNYKADMLRGHIGLTDFRSAKKIAEDNAEAERLSMGQEVVSISYNKEGILEEISGQQMQGKGSKGLAYRPEGLKMYWCNDTPGMVNPEQIINLLEPEELVTILPKTRIKPQCIVVKPGQVLFVSGLGRIDYVEGTRSIYLTAYVAHKVKLHVKDKEEANEFYLDNLGSEELGAPLGDEERLKKIPALVGREFQITGVDWDTASADIQLSSLGWVSVAAGRGMSVTLRAYTPGSKGLHLRSPSLLPSFTSFRGKRKGRTSFYRTR